MKIDKLSKFKFNYLRNISKSNSDTLYKNLKIVLLSSCN